MNASYFRIAAMAALAISASLGGLVRTACATEPGEIPSRTVNYADLNLNAPHGIEVLYQRITSAAQEVCDEQVGSYSYSLQQRAMWSRCVEDAMARAITKVGNERLTALYVQSRTKKLG